MAKANVLIDNDKVKVTEWSEYNYIVVPMYDGELRIVDKDNNETISKLTKGGAYYREKGVEHNVLNNNNNPYSFIEIELIK